MRVIKDGIVNGKKIELRDRPAMNEDYEVLEVGAVMNKILFASGSVVAASLYFDSLFGDGR